MTLMESNNKPFEDSLQKEEDFDFEASKTDGGHHKRKFYPDNAEKPDWKKFKNEKKQLKLQRKQAGATSNEVYGLSVRVKQIWEELRREDCKAARKSHLCQELYKLIEGKAKSLIFAHDTVRVIETLLAVGGDEYRSKLFVELKEHIVELSKNKYSRFFVTKLLKYGTKDQRNIIMKSLYGQVVQLLKHKVACEVVELAYNDYANATQRSFLMQEFYGPKFRLIKDSDIHCLGDALQKNETQCKGILIDVSKELFPIIEKGVFTNTMIHTLLKDFLTHCDEDNKMNVIDALKEKLLPIIHTRDGSRVAMMCLWFSPTKDRKAIIKSMKGHFQKISAEEHGFMVLLAAFDCIDDTVLLKKTVIAELVENLESLVSTESGKKVLTYLIAPRDKMFFHPDIVNVLSKGDGNAFTKKPREVTQKQLQEAISEPVLEFIHSNITSWAKNSHWTLFIGAALKSLMSKGSKRVFEQLALICADPYMPDNKEPHFLDLSYTTKLISYVISCDSERFKNGLPVFSHILLDAAGSELPGWILTNRSCFLLVKLIETDIPSVVEAVKTIIKPSKAKLEKLNFTGASVLMNKLK